MLLNIQALQQTKNSTGKTRFVTGNYSWESGSTKINMTKLNWEPLEERRARIKLCILLKAKFGLVNIPLNHLQSNLSTTRRGNKGYTIPSSNINSHLYSFYPNTIRLWNSLPDNVKNCKTIESFKGQLEKTTVRATYRDQA